MKYYMTTMSSMVLGSFLMLSVVCGVTWASENIDPGNTGAQHGWGENTGWLNAEPLGDGGPGVFVEDDGLSGYFWMENTGWASLSCLNNSVCGTRNYRVTNDGNGKLAGYGWGENTGWISFSCSNTNVCSTKNYGVTIDPATGHFQGDAWSENTGWIRFRTKTGTVSYGVTTSWRPLVLSLDIDLNGDANVWDGSMICRFLDPAITQPGDVAAGLVDSTGGRTDPQVIVDYLTMVREKGMLDADGNITSDGFDCDIITAFLFGITSDSLLNNGLGEGATRTTADQLVTFLSEFLPSMAGVSSTAEVVTVSSEPEPESLPSALTTEPTDSIVLEEPTSDPTTEPIVSTKPSSRGKKKGHRKRRK